MKKLSVTHGVLFGMLILGLLLRLDGIADTLPNPDEFLHISIARADSLSDMWQRSLYETHPPLGHALRYFTLMLGSDPTHERILSLLFGMVSILLFYRIGKEVGNTSAGLFLACVCAVFPAFTDISTAIRNYALFLMFSSAALLAYLRYTRTHCNQTLAAFSLCMSAACATHFSGFLMAAILGLDALYTLRYSTHRLKHMLALTAAYAPMLLLAIASYYFFFAAHTFGHGWRMEYVQSNKLYSTDIVRTLLGYILFMDSAGLYPRLSALPLFSDISQALFALIIGGLVLLYGWVLRAQYTSTVSKHLFVLFWVVAIPLSLLHIYPLTPTRHALYGVVFMLLPIASYVGNRMQQRSAYVLLAGICILCIILHINYRNSPERRWEQGPPRAAFEAMLADIKSRSSKEPPIIVNRTTSFYTDYAIDGSKESYISALPVRERRLNGHAFFSDPRAYQWTFNAKHFMALAEYVLKHTATDSVGILMIHAYAADMIPFYKCLQKQGAVIQENTWENSITLFYISRAAFAPDGAASKCSAHITPAP